MLGLLDEADSEQDARELVRRHLSSGRAGKWMLIIDIADNTDALKGTGESKGILSYLPESDSGLTLFTTRDKKTAQALPSQHNIHVEKMTTATASDLFKKAVTREAMKNDGAADSTLTNDEAATLDLLEELDCLPLAITQATSYIRCNVVSIREYVSHLRRTNQNLIYILSEVMRDQTRSKLAVNAVAMTWLVSFNRILQGDAAAAKLLQFISCIEWKAIPLYILPRVQPEARMTTAIGTLCAYFFLGRRNDSQT